MLTSDSSYFEVIHKPGVSAIKCVILDYDGTLTTLRKGWDVILSNYARSKINPAGIPSDSIEEKIQEFTIHAGGTTPRQLMSRLVDLIKEFKLVPLAEVRSIADYAEEYMNHFQEQIDDRIRSFSTDSESFVIEATRPMLKFINGQSTLNYVVTGSCEIAVTDELQKLEMLNHFERVYGASLEMEGNLKLDAISEILDRHKLKRCETLVIGDGSTEMKAARELGLPAIGIASNEHDGGLCEEKRELLKGLGAHAIIADYTGFQNVWNWLHEKDL